MSDRYLWDRSGEPDPDVQRLEDLLGRFGGAADRKDPARLRLSDSPQAIPNLLDVKRSTRVKQITRWTRPLQALAAIAATVMIGWLVAHFASQSGGAGWIVIPRDGTPRIGANRLTDTAPLAIGEWVETDAKSSADIRIAEIGETRIDHGTRVRLVRADETGHRLDLEHGTLHAHIWAPPRLFSVETRSSTAVDLGCAYTLSVDETGKGILRVTSGWVALEFGGRRSLIPAGALCGTRPSVGPGTPYFEEVSTSFQQALERLDFVQEEPGARAESLATVLEQARNRDALTLWHLMSRSAMEERGRVYDRLAQFVPPPAGVTREGILQTDRRMLGLYWDALELGPQEWWRLWDL